jgi:hypothetical protein
MTTSGDRGTQLGISAVLMAGDVRESAVLDLSAVLEGLVSTDFEIIVVTPAPAGVEPLAELRARAPLLPLRLVHGESVAAGCEAAVFGLLLVAAPDGRFDIRELHRLFEAIEHGADLAAGYRPRRTDRLVRWLMRFGWPLGLDWAYCLVPRRVRQQLTESQGSFTDVLLSARGLDYQVAEFPVSDRRPTLGATLSAGSRAA